MINRGGIRAYTPPASYHWADPPANPIGPWRIFYGTHRGVFTSRDEAEDPVPLPDWTAVQERMRLLIETQRHHGYAIWHASATAQDGRRAQILYGAPYE